MVADEPGAKPVPSAVRGRAQMCVGATPGTPSLFHTSQAEPSASTKGCGSIDPLGSASHTSGAVVLSTKGPSGFDAVATEMQKRSRSRLTRAA